MTINRKLLPVGATAVVALLLVVVLRPSAIPVETAIVRRDTLQVGVVAQGKTRVHDRYTIAAPVAGRLRRLSVREGSDVIKGQVIAQMDPAPEDSRTLATLRAQLAAAEARQAEAQAVLTQQVDAATQAEREAARADTLARGGYVSRESVEEATLAATTADQAAKSAQSALTAAVAEVKAARSALLGGDVQGDGAPAVPVRSPVTGRVLRLIEQSQRVVAAGAPLLEVGNPGGLEVVVDVLSQDGARMAPGDPMYLTDWGGDSTLALHVRLVEPAAFTKISALGVEEQRVNVIGDLINPPPSLGAAFRVEARIVTWTGTDVVTVPTSAMFRGPSGWQVFVIAGGKARRRSITIGHRNDQAAEVKEGLEPGERVVLYPSDQIDEGVRVKVKTEESNQP